MLSKMVMKNYYSLSEVSDILGKSKETLRRWDKEGKLMAAREPISDYRIYKKKDINSFLELFDTDLKDDVDNSTTPNKEYKVLELFAGAGGLAIGLEKAGIKCELLNEIDKWACQTLRNNRPNWNVLEGNIIDFSFK